VNAIALALLLQTPLAQAADEPSLLHIVAIDVQPTHPGPNTLCKLHLRIQNAGKNLATDLAFQVTVGGQPLAPYLNHVFRTTLDPGKETDVALYNFWSSESLRPYPADGRLVITVRLTGARWIDGRNSEVRPLPQPVAVTLTR
jgi:hypothetical protein